MTIVWFLRKWLDYGTGFQVPINSRASTFTKFCKRLHEFQKSKRFRLHANTVLNFFVKIANIFPKKELLKYCTLRKHSKLFD